MKVIVVGRRNRNQKAAIGMAMGEEWAVLCPGDMVLGFRVTSVVFVPDWTTGEWEDYK